MRADHVAMALLRMIVAGEIAGSWEKLGGSGLQLQNIAAIMEISATTNQEVASKFAAGQSREFQMLARDRHDPKLTKSHFPRPDPAMLARVVEDQNKEYKERPDKNRKDQAHGGGKDQLKVGSGAS